MKNHKFSIFCIVSLTILFMNNHLFAKTVHLRVGHDIPPFATPARGIDHWAKLVNKNTEGRIKVEVFPSGSLSDQKSSLEMMHSGAADGYLINFATHRTFFPLLSVESMPGLGFPDTVAGHSAHADTINAIIEKYPSAAKELADFKIVMFIVSPNSVLLSSKKDIHLPEDIKGLKVGANGARLELAKMIGAAPVFDAPPFAYQKLQTGVLDATTISFQAVGEFKIYEVAKYALNISWGQGGLPLVLSQRTWGKISDQDRKVILQAGQDGQLVTFKAAEGDTEKGKKDLLAYGGEIILPTADEKMLWDDKFQIIWDKWISDNEAAGRKDAKSILADYQQSVKDALGK